MTLSDFIENQQARDIIRQFFWLVEDFNTLEEAYLRINYNYIAPLSLLCQLPIEKVLAHLDKVRKASRPRSESQGTLRSDSPLRSHRTSSGQSERVEVIEEDLHFEGESSFTELN